MKFTLEQFVVRSHRRLSVARAMERIGLCLLGASIASVLLAPILIARNDNAMPMVLGAFGLAIAIGSLWSISQRPRVEATLRAIDDQFNLQDLISTAWSARDSNDPWQQTVLVLASARCEKLSAGDLIVRRWGLRAWGGVGLSMALALTLAAISTQPSPTTADVVELRSMQTDDASRSFVQDSPQSATARSTGPQSERDEQSADASSIQFPSESRAGIGMSQNADASGPNAASTDDELRLNPLDPANTSGQNDATGDIAGGGRESNRVNGNDRAVSGTVDADREIDSPMPGASSAPSEITGDLETPGQPIPARFRNIVRDYFVGD